MSTTTATQVALDRVRNIGIMTQVFDEETGNVEAVTVIEAGPCPVVTLRTQAADGYDAVQLAFEPVVDRKLSKGELGHLRKAGVGGHRHLVEFRGPSELQVGESVTVESFEPGERIKVSGTSIGKGFQGTIKRHNFGSGPRSHGSHNIRKPGSVGASATPSRVFKGKKMAGHMRKASSTCSTATSGSSPSTTVGSPTGRSRPPVSR